MKKKDLNNLAQKNKEDILKKLSELEKESTDKMIELKMGKLKNFHAVKSVKKSIAQLKTIMVLKELSSKESSKKGKVNEAS